MAATLTLTGTTGPGGVLTAAVFANVTEFAVNPNSNVLAFKQDGSQQTVYVSVAAATTVTATKSGTTWTLTIS